MPMDPSFMPMDPPSCPWTPLHAHGPPCHRCINNSPALACSGSTETIDSLCLCLSQRSVALRTPAQPAALSGSYPFTPLTPATSVTPGSPCQRAPGRNPAARARIHPHHLATRPPLAATAPHWRQTRESTEAFHSALQGLGGIVCGAATVLVRKSGSPGLGSPDSAPGGGRRTAGRGWRCSRPGARDRCKDLCSMPRLREQILWAF